MNGALPIYEKNKGREKQNDLSADDADYADRINKPKLQYFKICGNCEICGQKMFAV